MVYGKFMISYVTDEVVTSLSLSLSFSLSIFLSLRSMKRVIDPRLPINRRHYPIPMYRVSRHCWRSNWFREKSECLAFRSHTRRYCNKTRHGSREQDNFGREAVQTIFIVAFCLRVECKTNFDCKS